MQRIGAVVRRAARDEDNISGEDRRFDGCSDVFRRRRRGFEIAEVFRRIHQSERLLRRKEVSAVKVSAVVGRKFTAVVVRLVI